MKLIKKGMVRLRRYRDDLEDQVNPDHLSMAYKGMSYTQRSAVERRAENLRPWYKVVNWTYETLSDRFPLE